MGKTDNRPVAGALWMFCTGVCFVAVTAIVKHLGDGLPAAQMAFLRYLLGIVLLVPVLGMMKSTRVTRRQLGILSVRGTVHAMGVICWFYAMTRITIAEVTALNYLNPIYVTLGAVIFLGERIALRRILAVALAFAGAMIILRPGFRELDLGHLAMMVTAVVFGASYLMAKSVSGELSAPVIVAYLSLFVTLALFPFALAVWTTPTLTQLAWICLIAIFATAGHYSMTLAFAAAPLTVTQPVTFLQLVWAILLGWLVFGEGVDGFVVLGGVVIVGAVSFITWREHVTKSRQVTPAVNETKV